jgi:hypothetical protein
VGSGQLKAKARTPHSASALTAHCPLPTIFYD